MRRLNFDRPHETHEQWRQRTLAETGRFIEWGLTHPEKVGWIPRHPVGRGAFTERMKTAFWTLILRNDDRPDN